MFLLPLSPAPDIQIVKRPDGSDWSLGSGGFGKVGGRWLFFRRFAASVQLLASSAGMRGCDTQRGGQRPFTSHRRWLSFPIVLPLAPCSPPTCPGVQGVAAWRAAGGGQSAEHFLGHAAGGLRWKALSWRCAASPACPCCRGHLQSGTLAPEPGAAGYACLLVTAGQLAYPPCAKMRPACPAAGAGRLPPGDCNPQGKSSTELLCIYRCLLAGHLLRQ